MTFWNTYPQLAKQLDIVHDTMTDAIKVKNPQTQ